MRTPTGFIAILILISGCNAPRERANILPDPSGDSVLPDVEIPDGLAGTDVRVDGATDADTKPGSDSQSPPDTDLPPPDTLPHDSVEPDIDEPDSEDGSSDIVEPEPLDCSDNNKCTIDLYDKESGTCEYFPVGCNDGLPCTLDTCDPEKGCQFIVDEEGDTCCTFAEECDDGNPCTQDACESNACVHVLEPDPNCCLVDDDCDDGNECTDDFCNEWGCSHPPLGPPECCTADADCDDGDPCTWNRCESNGCSVTFLCCESEADCPAPASACGVTQCMDGWCALMPSGGDCCAIGALAPGSDSPIASSETSDHAWKVQQNGGSPVWVYEKSDNWQAVGGGKHGARFEIGPTALPPGARSQFAVEMDVQLQPERGVDEWTWSVKQGEFETPIAGKAVQSGSGWQSYTWDLSAWAGQEVSMVFQYHSVTGDTAELDRIRLQGPNWSTLCQPLSCSGPEECSDGIATTLEDCVAGQCVFALHPNRCTPLSDNAPCPGSADCTERTCEDLLCQVDSIPGCCTSSLDCNDNNSCTFDTCGTLIPGQCSHLQAATCCETDGDCHDGDPCTNDICHPTAGCIHGPKEGCCSDHADCDDGDVCTENPCVGGQCQAIPQCCTQDQDCAHLASGCDQWHCQNTACVLNPLPIPDCCTVDRFLAPFDTVDALQDWSLWEDSNAQDDVTWNLQNTFALSAPSALYYGNPNTWNYATGTTPNGGAIQSPEFQILAGAPGWVSFSIYLGNEFSSGAVSNADFDRLTVLAVLPEGETVDLWSSDQLEPIWWSADENGKPAGPQWTSVGPLLLPPHPKENFALRLRFQTFDGSINQFLGPVLDDIRVFQACE